jgi:hypothetical protein
MLKMKHFFSVPPVLVVWRRTAGQTGTLVTGSDFVMQ